MLLTELSRPPQVLECLDMVKAEYRDMPGLSLTKAQMQRMWGLDAYLCEALIDALVSARFIRRSANGGYVAFGSSH